jgi:hypothetical protein
MMDQLRNTTVKAGGALAASPERLVVPVQGMTCASCVAHVEKALARVPASSGSPSIWLRSLPRSKGARSIRKR